ncbi:MAG: tryptophan--tRNA ligase [Parcubacteria group bacterium]
MKIFSGIRPSGKLHLGNYLGAVKNWIELQDKPDTKQVIYAVVDYHGITTPFAPATYHEQITDAILDYLAAGVDPTKSLIIRQSKVPAHTELAWIFNTITPISWLERLPTYKEKLEQTHGKYNHLGLLSYPVLMASDILIYMSDAVPVGDDQKAHIDITNEIGKKFNSMFGETFPAVKMLRTKGERIKSLQDADKKMSKTGDESIALTDDPDTVAKKIKKAVTDSGSKITFDEKKKPAISNLLTIYHLLTDKPISSIESEYEGKTYADFKNDLAEATIEFIKPFQEKRKEFENNMDEVRKIMTDSEEKANEIANKNLAHIKEKIGL